MPHASLRGIAHQTLQNVESICMPLTVRLQYLMTAHKVRTRCITHDCNHTDNNYNAPTRALSCGHLRLNGARLRFGGSAADRLRRSCATRVRAGGGLAGSLATSCEKSNGARQEQLRVARTTAIDRRLSRRTRRASPASGGTANGKLSQCGWPRERRQQLDAAAALEVRDAARNKIWIALRRLLVREHLQRACGDVIYGLA